MGRIERGYECKFRALLRQSNAAKVDSRVQRLLGRARRFDLVVVVHEIRVVLVRVAAHEAVEAFEAAAELWPE